MPTQNDALAKGFDQTIVALDLIPVTPSDTEDLPVPARALRIRTGGTLRVTTYTGAVRDTEVADGELLLLFTTRVHASGTSAAGIEAMT